MRKIDAKYHIDWSTNEPPDPRFEVYDVRIVNTSTGEPILIDEPMFLFRARNRSAALALSCYATACLCEGYVASEIEEIEDALSKFLAFKRQHPERMKQPGSTMAPKV